MDYKLSNEPKMNSVRCPKSPNGAEKRKLAIFPLIVYFSRRKSAAKFLCVKTFSGKVIRHPPASSRAQMVGGGWPLLQEILHQSDPPLQKRRFPVYIRSYRVSHKTYIHYSAHVTIWEHAITNDDSLSVRPSVCHTRDPRLNGSTYWNAFCIVQ